MNGERGMMKYQPYQSLTEQSAILARMRYEKGKTEKPLISAERAEEINEILIHYEQEPVEAEYFEDGYRHRVKGTISRIDPMWKYLVVEGKRISFPMLLNLERI